MNVAWATSRDQNITEIQFSKDLRPERNHTEYPRIVMANFAALTRSSEKQASPFAVSLRFKDSAWSYANPVSIKHVTSILC